ncbi:MAG: hypothetical protein K9W44_00410 [Candidatus Lokiarchaeota archaeon]|nr:hypothetical protein [Candidatus Harpocratesius repetitus]
MHSWEDPYIRNFFTRKIMEWASLNLRQFSWRSDRNSYRVFIAEFLLQRTKSSQVAAVYPKFISKFPTEDAFKSATSEDFELLLKNLGLIKRIDYLLEIQKKMKASKFSFETIKPMEILGWPGVGNYTLSAFRCFARGERISLVDVNVIRVISRFFHFVSSKERPRNDPLFWKFADELLPDDNWDIYNYALIDFGSMVCVQKNPKCFSCILKDECSEYKEECSSNKVRK